MAAPKEFLKNWKPAPEIAKLTQNILKIWLKFGNFKSSAPEIEIWFKSAPALSFEKEYCLLWRAPWFLPYSANWKVKVKKTGGEGGPMGDENTGVSQEKFS